MLEAARYSEVANFRVNIVMRKQIKKGSRLGR